MSRIPQQLTMAVIIGNRGFFPSYLVAEAREQAARLAGQLEALQRSQDTQGAAKNAATSQK